MPGDVQAKRDDMMSDNRPDYVKCIAETRTDRLGKTWCGRPISSMEWKFLDIDHAVYTILSDARQVPCPDCLSKIVSIMRGAND